MVQYLSAARLARLCCALAFVLLVGFLESPAIAAGSHSNAMPPEDQTVSPDETSEACRSCSRVNSRFGRRRDPITRRRRFHKGVDIARPAGTEVHAWLGGVVLRADRMGRYGLAVDIRHDNGLVSRYAHLKQAAVSAGQEVETGQVIGLVGRTGRTTGANLHFEITQDGRRSDPNRLGVDFSRLVGPLPHRGTSDLSQRAAITQGDQ